MSKLTEKTVGECLQKHFSNDAWPADVFPSMYEYGGRGLSAGWYLKCIKLGDVTYPRVSGSAACCRINYRGDAFGYWNMTAWDARGVYVDMDLMNDSQLQHALTTYYPIPDAGTLSKLRTEKKQTTKHESFNKEFGDMCNKELTAGALQAWIDGCLQAWIAKYGTAYRDEVDTTEARNIIISRLQQICSDVVEQINKEGFKPGKQAGTLWGSHSLHTQLHTRNDPLWSALLRLTTTLESQQLQP